MFDDDAGTDADADEYEIHQILMQHISNASFGIKKPTYPGLHHRLHRPHNSLNDGRPYTDSSGSNYSHHGGIKVHRSSETTELSLESIRMQLYRPMQELYFMRLLVHFIKAYSSSHSMVIEWNKESMILQTL